MWRFFEKFSLLLTAFVIILSLCIPNFTSAKAFPDVQSNHWAVKEINYLSDKGIINGTPEGYFKPSDHVTRGQMALMLDLSLKLEKPSSYNHIFSDVTKGIYYYDSVHKLAHNNIVQREKNYFPDRSLSRAEMAVVLVKTFDLKPTGADVNFPDADHVGGLDEVLYSMNVKNVYAPKVSHTTQTFKDFLTAVANKGLTIKEAKSGVTLPINGLNSQFLAPVKEYSNDLNEWSAVLKITHGSKSFLFTGDAESKSEKDMVAAHGSNPKSDVLKPGHHGSKTSSSQPFLDAVKPSIAVISAGAGNRYGHPTQETLAKLNAMSVKVYRTDLNGTVVINSDGSNISVRTER
ncbi:S-layer homology domain-containing protein [Bacillus thuringiensis]|uniref:S-layer homology domain-containing protein n=1 Tax=Bacillus thuringiensis TaxID=1428 RepID=UPI001CFBEEA8|nr:S-layer homology domain-containing protein [Bacillus thuringiensis]